MHERNLSTAVTVPALRWEFLAVPLIAAVLFGISAEPARAADFNLSITGFEIQNGSEIVPRFDFAEYLTHPSTITSSRTYRGAFGNTSEQIGSLGSFTAAGYCVGGAALTDCEPLVSPGWDAYDNAPASFWAVFNTATDSYFIAWTFDGASSTANGTPYETATRIISVTPADEQEIATSSTATLQASIYINESDYRDDMYVRFKYAPQSYFQISTADPEALWTIVEVPIPAAGIFNLSTTTPILEIGRHTMVTEIRNQSTVHNILGWFGLSNLYDPGYVVATTTQFIAATTTAYDILVADTVGSIQDYIASSTISMASCTAWTEFSLIDCLSLLFIPQAGPIKQALSDFKDGFLSYVPFGYVTRVGEILAATTTVALPNPSYTFPDDAHGVDGLAGTTYTIDLWSDAMSDSPIGDEFVSRGDDPKTAWQIIEPYFTPLAWTLLFLKIVLDLLGMMHPHHGGRSYPHGGGGAKY